MASVFDIISTVLGFVVNLLDVINEDEASGIVAVVKDFVAEIGGKFAE